MPFWKPKKPKAFVQPEEATSQRHELPTDSTYRPRPTETEFSRRGDKYFGEGNYDRALVMYQEALSEHQDNAEVYLQMSLARILVSPAQMGKALQDVNSAIEINPFLGRAWKQKGDIHLRMGDLRSAEDALLEAIGMLQGWERGQAQQALADSRSRAAAPSPTGVTPISPMHSTSSAPPLELPVRPQGHHPSVQRDPALSDPVIPPPSTIPVSTYPSNAVPVQTTSPSSALPPMQSPSLTSQTPAAGLAPTNAPPANRSPSPNPAARADVLAQELEMPTEAPPSYTATPGLGSGLVNGSAFPLVSDSQLTNMTTTLQTRRQGCLYLKPFTAEGQIDSIQLFFYGKTYVQSILLDLPPQPQVHQTWRKYHVDTISYPGTTFLDHDCESTASYEGYHHGTTTVLGYAEEYREYQLTLKAQLSIQFELETVPPVTTVDKIVDRLQTLQLQPKLEDNTILAEFLGLSSTSYVLNTTQEQSIQDICMMYHRGLHDAPNRFVDFLTTGTFTRHIFGVEGIGLTNFAFHILLGAELLIRLRKAGQGKRYPNIMSKQTSALVYVAQQWMENVSIRQQPLEVAGAVAVRRKYILTPINHARQSEGLIRFAESIAWPYLDEARARSENLLNELVANPASVDPYLRDWLYGLCLPGKYFRHSIMSSLVLACPTTKDISGAPYYDDGLVVGNKSYWPKRTVLGRVLGGLANPKSTCGWIGPVPAPAGMPTGWVLLYARTLAFTTPVLDDLQETNLEILGFSEADATSDTEGLLREMTDMSKWNPPSKLPARTETPGAAPGAAPAVRLAAIRLSEVVVSGTAATVVAKQYRATLDFTCHGQGVSFTLYSNPVFVHAPKCAGSAHPIHERLVNKHMANLIPATDLKSGRDLPSTGALMIIDATQPGEEAMARAWCAETGKHAVIRKNGLGCFTCATNLATKRTGLGFGVLIWC